MFIELLTFHSLTPSLTHLVACWHFAVDDAAPGRHPLQITRAEVSLVPAEVLVIELSLQHVRDRLKPAVSV